MNKTQIELISRLINRHSTGSYKLGWTLTVSLPKMPHDKDTVFLSLQKLNEGNQAHKLAEKYPNLFRSEQVNFRLVNLFLLDDSRVREQFKGVI